MTESKSSKSSGEKCHIWGLAVVSGYGGNFTLIYDTLWSHGEDVDLLEGGSYYHLHSTRAEAGRLSIFVVLFRDPL